MLDLNIIVFLIMDTELSKLFDIVYLVHSFDFNDEVTINNNRFSYTSDGILHYSDIKDNNMKDLLCGKTHLGKYIHTSWGRLVPEHKDSWNRKNCSIVTRLKYQQGRVMRIYPADTMIIDYLDLTYVKVIINKKTASPEKINKFVANLPKHAVIIYTNDDLNKIVNINVTGPKVIGLFREVSKSPPFTDFVIGVATEESQIKALNTVQSHSLSLYPILFLHRYPELLDFQFKRAISMNKKLAAEFFQLASPEFDIKIIEAYRNACKIVAGNGGINDKYIRARDALMAPVQNWKATFLEVAVVFQHNKEHKYHYATWCNLMFNFNLENEYTGWCNEFRPMLSDAAVDFDDKIIHFADLIPITVKNFPFNISPVHSPCFITNNTVIPLMNVIDFPQIFSYLQHCSDHTFFDFIKFFEGRNGLTYKWNELISSNDKITLHGKYMEGRIRIVAFLIFAYNQAVFLAPDILIGPDLKKSLLYILQVIIRIVSIHLVVKILIMGFDNILRNPQVNTLENEYEMNLVKSHRVILKNFVKRLRANTRHECGQIGSLINSPVVKKVSETIEQVVVTRGRNIPSLDIKRVVLNAITEDQLYPFIESLNNNISCSIL